MCEVPRSVVPHLVARLGTVVLFSKNNIAGFMMPFRSGFHIYKSSFTGLMDTKLRLYMPS